MNQAKRVFTDEELWELLDNLGSDNEDDVNFECDVSDDECDDVNNNHSNLQPLQLGNQLKKIPTSALSWMCFTIVVSEKQVCNVRQYLPRYPY